MKKVVISALPFLNMPLPVLRFPRLTGTPSPPNLRSHCRANYNLLRKKTRLCEHRLFFLHKILQI